MLEPRIASVFCVVLSLLIGFVLETGLGRYLSHRLSIVKFTRQFLTILFLQNRCRMLNQHQITLSATCFAQHTFQAPSSVSTMIEWQQSCRMIVPTFFSKFHIQINPFPTFVCHVTFGTIVRMEGWEFCFVNVPELHPRRPCGRPGATGGSIVVLPIGSIGVNGAAATAAFRSRHKVPVLIPTVDQWRLGVWHLWMRLASLR